MSELDSFRSKAQSMHSKDPLESCGQAQARKSRSPRRHSLYTAIHPWKNSAFATAILHPVDEPCVGQRHSKVSWQIWQPSMVASSLSLKP